MKSFKIPVLSGIVLIFNIVACSGDKVIKRQLFNDNWKFIISDEAIDRLNMDSITWEEVILPHTPKIEHRVMQGQWQGICWYYKAFSIDKSAEGKRLIMKFEGAMNVSDFWINGKKVASHKGGYLPVVFDFTGVAKIGGENHILVRLDNRDNPVTGPKPMKNLDFNMYGGLYRDVFLEIKNPVHISDPILADKVAGGGIFVTYPEVSDTSATIHIKTNVNNFSDHGFDVMLQYELRFKGQLVAEFQSEDQFIESQSDADIFTEYNIGNPRLWSPLQPDLYELRAKLMSNNQIVDESNVRIGIRDIRITKEGFYINGKKMFLRGVNRHQEYPYIGYALSNNAQYRDALKIKEAGFDYVRLSHYPHAPAFMDACDELGILVLDAILGWQYYADNNDFKNYVWSSCRNLIRRDRNHPCVFAWELSLNESGMDKAFIEKAHTVGHEEYPGDQCYTAGWVNYAYDIYLQARQHRLNHYDETETPYLVSEYGDWEYYAMNAGFNQDQWTGLLQEERSSRQLLSNGEPRLLQQTLNIQEAHNDNFNTTAFGDGYWVMFDYNRGYSDDLEASGIMGIDRIPKYSYYFFKSQRNADVISSAYESGPMVYIASWWTKESPLDVRIFSNCGKVELFLNGRSLGIQTPDSNAMTNNLAHPPFTFHLKKFLPGELVAKAYLSGSLAATHKVRTPGKIHGLELTIDTLPKQAETQCNDVLFVYANLVDGHGTIVRENNMEVNFNISGDAKLISPVSVKSEAGTASALIQIGNTADAPIHIRANTLKIEKEMILYVR